jgi:hypothetical protein
MQITDIACEPPSPISAVTRFSIANPESELIAALIAIIIGVIPAAVGFYIHHEWKRLFDERDQTENISEKATDMSSFYEMRSKFCFQVDSRYGTGEMVTCQDDRKPFGSETWVTDATWYFKDLSTGECAIKRHRHYFSEGSAEPIPCWQVPSRHNVPQDNHWIVTQNDNAAP